MAYPIARHFIPRFLKFFIRSISGLENIPKEGSYIIACKHTGTLDGIFIASVIISKVKRKLHFISNVRKRGWFWKKPIFERWAGSIQFDKTNPSKCLETAMEYLKKGEIVGIFPSGLLQESDKMRKRGKTGVARLALWSQMPVIPVGLHNFHVVKRGAMIIKHLMNPHNMRITIGQPMTFPDAYNKPITHDLLREVTRRVVNRLEELSAK
ncbi:lysophospholipid acyltransferase family protein [Patescibacteria group bacterium]